MTTLLGGVLSWRSASTTQPRGTAGVGWKWTRPWGRSAPSRAQPVAKVGRCWSLDPRLLVTPSRTNASGPCRRRCVVSARSSMFHSWTSRRRWVPAKPGSVGSTPSTAHTLTAPGTSSWRTRSGPCSRLGCGGASPAADSCLASSRARRLPRMSNHAGADLPRRPRPLGTCRRACPHAARHDASAWIRRCAWRDRHALGARCPGGAEEWDLLKVPALVLNGSLRVQLTGATGTPASQRHARARPATLRTQLINVPVRVARSARSLTPHLPACWPGGRPGNNSTRRPAAPPAPPLPDHRPRPFEDYLENPERPGDLLRPLPTTRSARLVGALLTGRRRIQAQCSSAAALRGSSGTASRHSAVMPSTTPRLTVMALTWLLARCPK